MIFTVVVYIEVADLNNDKKVYSESKKIFNKCKLMLPLLITEVNLIYYFVIVLLPITLIIQNGLIIVEGK